MVDGNRTDAKSNKLPHSPLHGRSGAGTQRRAKSSRDEPGQEEEEQQGQRR